MSDPLLPDSRPTVISVTVEESDDYPESLVFTTADGEQRLFAAPSMNQTPAQSQRILKLRTQLGQHVAFADETGHIHAELAYDAEGDASMTYYAPDGSAVWTAAVTAADAVPDAPVPVPRLKRKYRWLALAFGLFLFVTVEFVMMLPVASYSFVLRAIIGFGTAVAGGVAFLMVVRSRLGL